MNQISAQRIRDWYRRQDTLSRVSRAWSRALRGVDAYFDPVAQQTIELATGYKSVWTNGQGEYILSPNPSYNPKRKNW